ncbi:MAG: hypothetical protein ABIS29_18825 [Vicinamibacterales bacterium]
MSESRDNPDNVEVVHEESDVNVSIIIRYGIGLLVVGMVMLVFLWWLLGMYERQHERAQTQVYPLAAGQQDRLPPFPRFQQNPQQELQELRAKQRALLEGYGWVNKDAGIARIPIEDAMKMVVERGLPVREGPK